MEALWTVVLIEHVTRIQAPSRPVRHAWSCQDPLPCTSAPDCFMYWQLCDGGGIFLRLAVEILYSVSPYSVFVRPICCRYL